MNHPGCERLGPEHSGIDRCHQIADALLPLVSTLVAVASRSLTGLQPEVTMSQYRILELLNCRGPQRVTDIAAALNIQMPAASRLRDRLERRQLVSRCTKSRDLREVHQQLTSTGAQLLAEITSRQRAALSELASTLPSTSPNTLATALRSLAATADSPSAARMPETHTKTGPKQARRKSKA